MKTKSIFLVFIFLTLSNSIFSQTDIKLTQAVRSEVIEKLSKMLVDFYVYPEKAKKMSDLLKANLNNGKYDKIDNFSQFGTTLERDLFQVVKDRHLEIYYDPAGVENERNNRVVSETEIENNLLKQKQAISKTNFGFSRLEILSGNIGYLKLDRMERLDWSGETAVMAMNFLSNTDYIIIDLRDNTGGSIKMIPFLASYFYNSSDDILIFEKQIPCENTTIQYRTLPYLPGKRMAKTPLYILIGRNTISAGENLAYTLQKLGRAIVVGEKTVFAGAHILRNSRIVNDYYLVNIPEMLCVNPITKTDWEGIGVIPDIDTKGKDALETLYNQLLEKQLSQINDENLLNQMGYSFLNTDKIELAILTFKETVRKFPQSSNAYDSLAEAYMLAGNKELAIKNYEKSLELNPQNTNAVEQLKKLK